MKTFKIPFVMLFLAFNINAADLNILTQLKQINSYWIYHTNADDALSNNRAFDSDRERIQLHLQLVEKTLRANTKQTLSEEQKSLRLQILDVLHEYWVTGTFPQNTRHSIRTPYFIDLYGTACAVGQLIINSGYSKVAEQISRENNNGYIVDLVVKYPQISTWADKHGFAIEELAWIQPCYPPPPDTAGLRHPSCHNAMNGYFCPDVSQLQGPLTKSFYTLSNNNWVPNKNWCDQWVFERLQAGKYKWEVKDGLNIIHTFSIELLSPPKATVAVIPSGDFNGCNGIITPSVQGGVLPFSYWWGTSTKTTSVLSSVCEELVYLWFYEAGLCPQTFTIDTRPVGLPEHAYNALSISPNPVNDMLRVSFDPGSGSENKTVKVLNIHGQLVFQEDLRSEITTLNLSQLPSGLYFVQVDNYKVGRFVKE